MYSMSIAKLQVFNHSSNIGHMTEGSSNGDLLNTDGGPVYDETLG